MIWEMYTTDDLRNIHKYLGLFIYLIIYLLYFADQSI